MASNPHLTAAVLSNPTATAPGSLDGLDATAKIALTKASEVQQWYKTAIPKKRFGAIATRLGAILLGSVATILPTVLAIGGGEDSKFLARWVPIGGVLAVVAALLVLIDKVAGYSTGWMRYIGADQDVRSRYEMFQFAWAKERLMWNGPSTIPLPSERAAAMLDLIVGFVAAVNDIVKQETQVWMAEFRGALADLDKTTSEARAQALASVVPKTPRGALEVEVKGVSKLDHETWSLQLGTSASPIQYVGTTTAAIAGLTAGPAKVKVAGMINAKPWSVERIAQVEADKTTHVEVSADPVN